MSFISVLCAMTGSYYYDIPGLDVWDFERDAYRFIGSNPVIVHPPCQQWSRLRAFAKYNADEKELAYFCLNKVKRNGGVFEHPAGSSFFREMGIRPTISVDQRWFGFQARKTTWLYFVGCVPVSFPLCFDAITHCVSSVKPGLKELSKSVRSKMTLSFAHWLVDCVKPLLVVA